MWYSLHNWLARGYWYSHSIWLAPEVMALSGGMARSLSVVLFVDVAHFRFMELSLDMVRSSTLVLTQYRAHSLFLVLSNNMVHSASMVRSKVLARSRCSGTHRLNGSLPVTGTLWFWGSLIHNVTIQWIWLAQGSRYSLVLWLALPEVVLSRTLAHSNTLALSFELARSPNMAHFYVLARSRTLALSYELAHSFVLALSHWRWLARRTWYSQDGWPALFL